MPSGEVQRTDGRRRGSVWQCAVRHDLRMALDVADIVVGPSGAATTVATFLTCRAARSASQAAHMSVEIAGVAERDRRRTTLSPRFRYCRNRRL